MTNRFGEEIELVASRQLPSIIQARKMELALKRKKNSRLAIFALSSASARDE
jgi:hypothetical protein